MHKEHVCLFHLMELSVQPLQVVVDQGVLPLALLIGVAYHSFIEQVLIALIVIPKDMVHLLSSQQTGVVPLTIILTAIVKSEIHSRITGIALIVKADGLFERQERLHIIEAMDLIQALVKIELS